jgi:hypothetical protein
MSKRHGVREQKRLAKQKAKRDAQCRQLARQNSPDPSIRSQSAELWPIVATLVPESLKSLGIGNAVIARRTPEGKLAYGMFLLDVYCLGVKDAFWRITSPSEFQSMRKKIDQKSRLREVSPEYFAKLVYRTAEYGQSLGFPPHPDFRHAQLLLAGIDLSLCSEEFEFGQDGRPLYIRGPSESLEKARIIADRVNALGGHYTVGLKPTEIADLEFDADSFDEEDEDCVDSSDAEKADAAPRFSWLPWRKGSR